MPEKFDLTAISKGFSQAADTYQKTAVLQCEAGNRLLERLDYIKLDPTRILDLGCGPGYFTRLLAKRFKKAEVVGVDIAQLMLRRAYQQRPWLHPFQLMRADACTLPLATHSVDFIFSNLMVHWVSEPALLWSELHRILKPGGLLLFTTVGPDTLTEIRQSWAAVDDTAHVHPFLDMHDVGDALLRAGFRDPVMDRQEICLTYDDPMRLMRELQHVGVSNKSLDVRRQALTGKHRFQQFLEAFSQHKTSNNKYPARYEIIFGHAFGSEKQPTSGLGNDNVVRVSLDKITRRNS